MKINNAMGTNESLHKFCEFLGTSDLSRDLDELEEDVVREYALRDGLVIMGTMQGAHDYYGVYLVDGDAVDSNWHKKNPYHIASFYTVDEGPHWEMPLSYLVKMIQQEMDRIKTKDRAKKGML